MTDMNNEPMAPVENPMTDPEVADMLEQTSLDDLTVESEVTEEDLSVNDLVQNGADPLDIRMAGEQEENTIEARILQEEPDPASDIVPRQR